MSTSPVCAHGSLGRQCRVCELEQEVALLTNAAELQKRVMNAAYEDKRKAERELWGAEATIATLRAALAQVEWVTKRGGLCQWCGGSQQTGHEADCARQAALGLKDGER